MRTWAVSLVLLMAGPLRAAVPDFTLEGRAPKRAAVRTARPDTLQLGYRYGYVTYREPGVMEQRGSLHGATAKAQFLSGDMLYLGAELTGLFGTIQYDGRYEDDEKTPAKAPANDYIMDARALVGGNLTSGSDDLYLIPYFGFGYRQLNDQIQIAGAYNRDVVYQYIPIGVMVNTIITPEYTLGVDLEYAQLLSGRVRSRLTDLGAKWSDVENHQSNGFGLRAAINNTWNMNKVNLLIAPYLQYWNLSDSDVQPASTPSGRKMYHEPANDSTLLGIVAGVSF